MSWIYLLHSMNTFIFFFSKSYQTELHRIKSIRKICEIYFWPVGKIHSLADFKIFFKIISRSVRSLIFVTWNFEKLSMLIFQGLLKYNDKNGPYSYLFLKHLHNYNNFWQIKPLIWEHIRGTLGKLTVRVFKIALLKPSLKDLELFW